MTPLRPVLPYLALFVAAAPAAAQQPRKVAFLVGVGTYDYRFRPLGESPENDVLKLAAALKAADPRFDTTVLTGSGQQGTTTATRKNVLAEYAKVLNGGGRPLATGDTLVVCLCGHGVQIPPAPGMSDQPFFCPRDAQPNRPLTMVPLNGLIDDAAPQGCTTLFLVDACRSVIDANGRGFDGAVVTLQRDMAVLFSCDRGEEAYQSERLKHGLFTYAVLKVLQEIRNSEEALDWDGLVSRVKQAFVGEDFRAEFNVRRPQTPVSAGQLGRVELVPRRRVALRPPPAPAGDPMADELKKYVTARDGGTPQKVYLGGLSQTRRAAIQAAAADSPAAQFLYARAIMDAAWGPKDEEKAYQLYFRAANAGQGMAMVNLGVMYNNGTGVVQDYAKAREWYEKSADAGVMAGLINLGNLYMNGKGVAKDEGKAVELYRKAADAGERGALTSLGLQYEAGRGGLAADPVKAADLYRRAADKFDPLGMLRLGLAYGTGKGVAKSDTEAVRWLKKAADAGSGQAMNVLGVAYDNAQFGLAKDSTEALRWFRAGAEAGFPGSIVNLGVLYGDGRGGVAKDERKAFALFLDAAEAGSTNGMFFLGLRYAQGRGVEANSTLSLEWYRKAANAGNTDAMVNVGVAYEQGNGVRKDYDVAVDWFRQAADGGNHYGLFNLGQMHEDGKGVPKSIAEARRLYRKAADLGSDEAKKALLRLGGA